MKFNSMKLYKIKDLGDDTYLSNYNAKDYPNNDLMPINENKFTETFTKEEVREKIIDYLRISVYDLSERFKV